MKYDKIVKDIVLSGVDIYDVVSKRVDLKKVGINYRGLCPFHSEKTPSFYVNQSKGNYHCFGCRAHGNAIDFVMQTENLDFLESLETLATSYNIDLSQYQISDNSSNKNRKAEFDILYNLNSLACKFYHQNLLKNPFALEYFRDRGLNDKTIKIFGLGYSSDSWSELLDYLKQAGYSEEDIFKSGLASKSESGKIFDRFRNRFMFPIFDYSARVLGFGARSRSEEMAKYLNSPETLIFQKSKILFGDRLCRKAARSDDVILVEGYMDLIQVYQAGFRHILASMGTALTDEQAFHISKRYKNVFFAYDMDNAGRNAISRSIPILEKYGVEVRVVDILPAKDPDEYIKKFGKASFEHKLSESQNIINFRLVQIKNKYDISDAKERYEYISESLETIKNACEPLEAEIYLQELSDISKVSYSKLFAEYNLGKNNVKEKKYLNDAINDKANGDLKEQNLQFLYERELLKYAIKNKEYANVISEKIGSEFKNDSNLELFLALSLYYISHDSFEPISFSETADLELALKLEAILESSGKLSKDGLNKLLSLWMHENQKIELEEIDKKIKSLSFLDDEKSKIELRTLRLKRAALLKTIYNNRNRKNGA